MYQSLAHSVVTYSVSITQAFGESGKGVLTDLIST